MLSLLGFEHERGSRHWYHPDLQLPIEIPDNHLEGSLDKLLSVEVQDGLTIEVIGIEDLALDRLRAAVYWKSESDFHWAVAMLSAHHDTVDTVYITTAARSEDPALAESLQTALMEAERCHLE